MKIHQNALLALTIICLLAAACSFFGQTPAQSDTLPTQTVSTLAGATALPAPTETPAPTPELVFTAGIPATIEGCNHFSIFNAAGAIDPVLIETQMQKLVNAEKDYLQQKDLGAQDISEIVSYSPRDEAGKLPFPYARAEGKLYPVSCSLVDANDGTWRLMIGVMIKQNIQATSVAVAHFLLDHPGLEQYMITEGSQPDYTQKFSPEATFAQLSTGPRWYFSIRPWVPAEHPDQQSFPKWRISQELMKLNQDAPVALNMYLSGTKLDPAMENSYVPKLEKMIFPVMWLWVTAVN